jgi:predicted dinucleotide-binding enzyme
VVVFAVYYPGIKDAVRQYADQLAGKVVVDITNPVDTQTWDRLATPPGSSSAEEVQQLVPQGTSVVKAFNTTFAGTLLPGGVGGQQLDVLIAGDDAAAKQTVSRLASDDGLRPIDVGLLSRAQQLEQLGFLHSSLQQPFDLGFGSAIKLVMPSQRMGPGRPNGQADRRALRHRRDADHHRRGSAPHRH